MRGEGQARICIRGAISHAREEPPACWAVPREARNKLLNHIPRATILPASACPRSSRSMENTLRTVGGMCCLGERPTRDEMRVGSMVDRQSQAVVPIEECLECKPVAAAIPISE